MRDLCRLIGWMVVDLIRSRVMLEAEIWTLRQQINVLRRTAPKKLSFCAVDRMIFVGLYRLFPKIRDALAIVKPDTLVLRGLLTKSSSSCLVRSPCFNRSGVSRSVLLLQYRRQRISAFGTFETSRH